MTRVFAIPALLAILTAAGLLGALLIDGIGPVISWVALGVPLAVIGWCVGRFWVGWG